MSDHQVGVSDLGDRGYPWAHQSNPRHEHGPHNSSAHLRHLEIGAHITYGNSHPSFNHDSHGLFIRRFPELPSSHPYSSVPTKPLAMTAASFCHRRLGPISRPQAPSAIGPPFLPRTSACTYLALGFKTIIIAILRDKKFTLGPRIGPSQKTVRAAWRH